MNVVLCAIHGTQYKCTFTLAYIAPSTYKPRA